MTRIKSLKQPERGYGHRTHRSKKGRENNLAKKKIERQMYKELLQIAERKYQKVERKFK